MTPRMSAKRAREAEREARFNRDMDRLVLATKATIAAAFVAAAVAVLIAAAKGLLPRLGS